MACGFQNLKPRPEAVAGQTHGLTWLGPGQAGTSRFTRTVDADDMTHFLPFRRILEVLYSLALFLPLILDKYSMKKTVEHIVVVFATECTLGISHKYT
jgi:hypothetical protein